MTVSRCVITSTHTGADTAAVSLALEEDRKAHEPEPVDAKPVDPAVTALPGDVHAVEVGFAQQPPGQSLESIARPHRLIPRPDRAHPRTRTAVDLNLSISVACGDVKSPAV